MLLASTKYMPKMLLNILQWTIQGIQQGVIWSKMLVGVRLRKSGLEEREDIVVEIGISANPFSLHYAGGQVSPRE